MTAEDSQELLTFPTDYPIKVVARRSEGLRVRIDEIVLRHAPDLDHELTSERASAQANFIAITYTIRATSRMQVEKLAAALQASDDVIMLI
jgi:putative lipoic acid-binding regulatory protein